MSKLQSDFNSATDFLGVLSLGSVVLSSVLLVTPVKAVGYIGIGGGVGAFTASVVARKKHLQVATQRIEELLDAHRAEVGLQNELLLAKDSEIATLRGDCSKGFNHIESLNQKLNQSTYEVTKLQNQVDSLTVQNQAQKQLVEDVTEELDRLIALARTAVEESLDEWAKRLSSLVVTKKEQYPKLADRLSSLLDEGNRLLDEYASKLEQTPSKWDSLADLLSLYYCLNDDLTNIKIKAVRAIAKLTNQETQLELQDWQTANLVSRDDVEHLIRNYEAALNEFRVEYSTRFEGVYQFATSLEGQTQKDDEFVKGIIAKMQELEAKIHQLSKPMRYLNATRTDMVIANIVIGYFERLGIVLDRAGTDYRGYEASLEFITDRTGRLVLARELNEHVERLQPLTHVLNTLEFKLDPETGLMILLVRWANPPKEPVDSKLYEISKLGAKRGFLVTGHPGSGKSSVMRFLGQVLGGRDAQKLALTPHEEDTDSFQDAGFAVVNDIPQIIQQIGLLDEEIKLRAKDSNRRFKLVIAIDELGRVLDSVDKPDDLMETVKHIAVEGRKLEVIVLVGNHSQTTSAIKMDGEFRNSFYQLFLVGAARYAINQPGRDVELKKWEKEWVSEAAYPCLALINGQYKVCKHPTHHEYSDYKDSGNPPLNLEKWDVNPLTIKLASGCQHLAEKEDRQYHFSLSEDEERVIEYAQKKGDWVTIKGLANTAYFRKDRGLNLSDVRGIVEGLNQTNVITIDTAAKPPRYRLAENPVFATAAKNG